jgi:hypothetical protein
MPTCGYVCPVCEGRGFLQDTLEDCTFCKINLPKSSLIISDHDWIEQVHGSNCCSDIGQKSETKSEIK